MHPEFSISPEIIAATNEELKRDPVAKEISELNDEITKKQAEIINLEAKLYIVKSNHKVSIRWRESVIWCLTIDSLNYRYFVKNVAGVYKCIAFKHKVDITAEIKTKINATLSSLFKDNIIGRTEYKGAYFYGLKKFFKDGLEELKDEHKSGLDRLIY